MIEGFLGTFKPLPSSAASVRIPCGSDHRRRVVHLYEYVCETVSWLYQQIELRIYHTQMAALPYVSFHVSFSDPSVET